MTPKLANHEKPLDASHCQLCARYHSDPLFRALIDGGKEGFLAAQSRGIGQTLQTATPCVHLGEPNGKTVSCPTCKGHVELKLFSCAIHGDCTPSRRVEGHGCCADCPQRSTIAIPAGEIKPGDPRVGVVIGSYKWPALIDLQIRVIRRTCGDVPILVSDDCSPGFPLSDRYAGLAKICAAHPDVALWPNVERIGHTGGDVAAFWKGIIWGASRGLQVVAKLSQRFLATTSRWLQEGAADLLASNLPLASQRCRGREIFDLRTEACLLDVAKWNRPDVLARLTPRRYWQDRPAGLCAEAIIYGTLKDSLGGVFWPWSLLGGEERYRRVPGVIWHTANSSTDYHELARQFGVKLDMDFHNSGWQQDLKAGTYLYG